MKIKEKFLDEINKLGYSEKEIDFTKHYHINETSISFTTKEGITMGIRIKEKPGEQ